MRGDARRLLCARLVVEHELRPHDPLVSGDARVESRIADLLLASEAGMRGIATPGTGAFAEEAGVAASEVLAIPHLKIYEAIKRQGPGGAALAMERHLKELRGYLFRRAVA
ncbi:MAG: hypothetical protein IH782_09730 [candidate division NC10 bacterium]|nr:hypothetical protein [candidate division NC10 bacterium]